MIQKETLVRIVDNSGGRVARCIHLYGLCKGEVGDLILVSMQKIRNKKKPTNSKIKVENHVLYKALIVQTRGEIKRKDGSRISFTLNGAVLLTKLNEKILGSRIMCPVVNELRSKNFINFNKY